MEITELTVPYLPDSGWVSGLLNGSAAALSNRDLTRTLVRTPGQEAKMLSVPVEGGRSSTKSLPASRLIVSGHGRWPEVHIGALEAAYGRTPFYRHIEHEIVPILRHSPGRPLLDLNRDLFNCIRRFLRFDELLPELLRLRDTRPEWIHQLAAPMLPAFDSTLTLLDPLSRFGPDTLFLLLKPEAPLSC